MGDTIPLPNMQIDQIDNEGSFSFWKNFALVAFFFILTPIVLGTSLFSLVSLKSLSAQEKVAHIPGQLTSGARVFASLPAQIPSVAGAATSADARVEIIRAYLKDYRSPLEPLAEFIVATSDKYGLDFRLTTAIAQQESNLCKYIPSGSYNCWGWGIHSRGSLGFSSFEEGIETVSQGLKENYIDMGYVSPDEIMAKYTPLSPGTWAIGVNKFMSDME